MDDATCDENPTFRYICYQDDDGEQIDFGCKLHFGIVDLSLHC